MNLSEILRMSMMALRTNKLRSALTMTGVAVGVFSIIGVMTLLGAIRGSIESGLSFLGSNIFQFAKYPVISKGPDDDMINRRNISLAEGNEYKRLMNGAANVVCLKVFDGGKPVSYQRKKIQGMTLIGTNENFLIANSYTLGYGRNLSPDDVDLGRPVTVVGKDVETKLFPNETPIGKWIKVNEKPYQIVGVLEGKGSSFGQTQDNSILLPITKYFNDFGSVGRTVNVATQSTSQATYNATFDKAVGAMRIARGLKVNQANDFEIYTNATLLSTFAQVADVIGAGAFVISAIALLAAGIGIMNIMLVSVTERTREIGLRKAIGARKNDVVRQFLLEAIMLSQAGGLAGVLFGIGIGDIIAVNIFKADIVMPYGWALAGMLICSGIGIVFGFYPAWRAASLDPVEALRYE
jgi:putative ABC transport system permease protein